MDRNKAISYMRVVAMLLVVLGHALGIYSSSVYWPFDKEVVWYWTDLCKVIYSIHMPVFFVISGFLYSNNFVFNNKYQNQKKFIIDKGKRLIIPYLVWVIVQAIVFYRYLSNDTIYNGGFHLWFLLALFWQFVFFSTFKRLWVRNKIIVNGTILLFILAAVKLGHVDMYMPRILCLRQFVSFMPFFYFGLIMGNLPAGDLIASIKERRLLIHKTSIAATGGGILLILNIITLMLVCYFALFPPLKLLKLVSNVVLLLFIGSTYMVLEGKEIRNPKIQQIVGSLDKCSMGIYILHHIIIWLILDRPCAHQWLLNHYNIGPIILFVVSLLVSWCGTIAILRIKKLKFILG